MQKLAVILVFLAVVAYAASLPTFEEYVKMYGKTYVPGSSEWREHESRYLSAAAAILAHNELFNKGASLYTMGINHFTDMTRDQHKRLLGYAGAHTAGHGKHGTVHQKGLLENFEASESLNWLDYGIVTPVKNQGKCGSCWTFAATATVESHLAKETGKLTLLSEQQLVDCIANEEQCGGTGGCAGGTGVLAYDYLIEAGGSVMHFAYPYKSYWGTESTCLNEANPELMKGEIGAKVVDYVRVANNSYDAMMEAISLGPVVINVDASAWSSYAGGIFDGCTYDSNIDINHAVQLVGYGTDENDNDYWLVRNSWGPYWGEDGYIRLKRYASEDTPCGWDTTPLDGTECADGASEIYVCGTCGMFWDAVYPVVTAP